MNSEIIMDPGSSIILQTGATLDIQGCHIYSCSGVWQGIKVASGATINIGKSSTRSSFVEDADVAVDYNYNNEWVAMQNAYDNNHVTNFATINNTIFNRNNIAIRIGTNYNDYLAMPPSVFSIGNNVFTSRKIPFTKLSWPAMEEVRMLNPAVTGATYTYPNLPQTLQAPYIPNVYADDNFGAYLKQAIFNTATLKKPDAAIVLNNLHFNVARDPLVLGVPTGNSTNYNNTVYDNMAIGIKAYSSPLTVVNSVFQKAYINATTPLGYGI